MKHGIVPFIIIITLLVIQVSTGKLIIRNILKGIEGVHKIKDGYNPATWMLEVTSVAQEAALGINFTDEYKNSELYR